MYSRLTHWGPAIHTNTSVNPVLIVSYNGVRLFDATLLPKPTLTSYQIGRLGANFRLYKIFSFKYICSKKLLPIITFACE